MSVQKPKTGKNKILIFAVAAVIAIIGAAAVYICLSAADGVSPEQALQHLSDEIKRRTGLVDNSADIGIAVHYVDVGEGDCAFVVCDGKAMIIDAGSDGSEKRIFSALNRFGIHKLDCAVASHPHADHIGGMDGVIERFKPDYIYMPGIKPSLLPDTSECVDFMRAAESSGAQIKYAVANQHFELGGASVKILAPVKLHDEINDMSVVVRVDYGKVSFLFAGDAGFDEEKDILEKGGAENCDVLKVSHHGSETACSEEFIAAVSPSIAVISVGLDNTFGHPSAQVVKTLGVCCRKIFRTDINGDITISSDGNEIYTASG